MPSSESSSEYWIDGSHRKTALEDFYVVGPELGRYQPGEGRAGNVRGRSPPGMGVCPDQGRDRPGGRRDVVGMEGWIRGDGRQKTLHSRLSWSWVVS